LVSKTGEQGTHHCGAGKAVTVKLLTRSVWTNGPASFTMTASRNQACGGAAPDSTRSDENSFSRYTSNTFSDSIDTTPSSETLITTGVGALVAAGVMMACQTPHTDGHINNPRKKTRKDAHQFRTTSPRSAWTAKYESAKNKLWRGGTARQCSARHTPPPVEVLEAALSTFDAAETTPSASFTWSLACEIQCSPTHPNGSVTVTNLRIRQGHQV
jgi:hypothetical protein